MMHPLLYRQQEMQRINDANNITPGQQGMTSFVVINISDIWPIVNKMADVVVNKSYNTPYPYTEHQSIEQLWYQAINAYIEFLAQQPTQPIIGVDYYLQEYFPSVAPVIMQDKYALSILNMWFAAVCKTLASKLQSEIAHLYQNGYGVERIQSIAVDQHNQGYILEGEDFGMDCYNDVD
ncbi:hypothetical protein KEN19_CDS0389 [Pseudomonas phage vB_PaePAO1-KEN19]